MTGLVRKATLFSVCGLLAAGVALADVPDPVNSSVVVTFESQPLNGVYLGGHDGAGTPDPSSEVLVTVKDLANNPIMGSIVVIDFSGCNDVHLCNTQVDGSIADCATKTARMSTDVLGQAHFKLVGWGDHVASLNGSPLGAVNIYADGVNLYQPGSDNPNGFNAATFDLDGGSGVGGGDLSLWLDDFGLLLAQGPARADYNFTGDVGGADLSIWLDYFGKLASPYSCTDAGGGPLGADCAP